jgi:hypothetical protein
LSEQINKNRRAKPGKSFPQLGPGFLSAFRLDNSQMLSRSLLKPIAICQLLSPRLRGEITQSPSPAAPVHRQTQKSFMSE